MPMVEYKCPKCGVFEGYQPSPHTIHATRMCPKCHREAKLIISVPASRNPAYGIQK